MRAELVFFGRGWNMARRSRRRALVVAIYTALAGLFALGFALDLWRSSGALMLFAALGACWLFLGGHYHRGLIKPFNGKPPRNQDGVPSPVQLLFGMRFSADLDEDYRSDERELADRDRAHYLAYQGLGMALAVLWLPVMFLGRNPHWLEGHNLSLERLVEGMMLVCLALFLTLPQAILLWTEPDMETETSV